MIVVDNASTDGTAAAVRRRYPSVRLAELTRNTGGAGGFAYGMALALAGDADLIWLMDDDTVPEPGALRALLAARERYPAQPPALVASRVVWTDGRAHPMNTPRSKPFAGQAERVRGRGGGLPADPFGIVCLGPRGRRGVPPARPAAGGLLPVERRLRVHHPAAARPGRPALPGQRRRAQDGHVRLDGHRPRGALLLRGPEQDLDVQGSLAARARRAGGVHRLDAAPLGTHLRPLTRPAHARSLTGQGHRRRGADETAANRGGARGGRPARARARRCPPRRRARG